MFDKTLEISPIFGTILAFVWIYFFLTLAFIESSFRGKYEIKWFFKNWNFLLKTRNPDYWASFSNRLFLKLLCALSWRIFLSCLWINKFTEFEITFDIYFFAIFFIFTVLYFFSLIERLGNRIFSESFYTEDFETLPHSVLLDRTLTRLHRLQQIVEAGEISKNQLTSNLIDNQELLLQMQESIIQGQNLFSELNARLARFENVSKSSLPENFEPLFLKIISQLENISTKMSSFDSSQLESFKDEIKSLLKSLTLAIMRKS